MEALWVGQRAHLRHLFQLHPDWTAQHLADALGCSRSMVSKWRCRIALADPDDVSVLFSRSRAPHHHPARIDKEVKERIQALSLRATAILRKTLELARQPIAYATLCEALLQTFPRATTQQVERFLWQIWEHGLLISTLRPSLTSTQPACALYEQLKHLHGVEQERHLLETVLSTSTAFDLGGGLASLRDLAQIQHALAPSEQGHLHIQVDSTLALQSPTLHACIGAAAAHAAEHLLRLTPFPQGSPGLQEYRRRFLETYGLHAEVPVLELLSPELGLGAPPNYAPSLRVSPAHVSLPQSVQQKRERTLHFLVQQALNTHSLEVVLNEAQLSALETWSPHLGQAPRSLEVYLQIHATSREALDRGQWCAVVGPNPGSLGAGCSFGRFFDLLGEPGIHALQEILTREESLDPEAVFAELSFQHRSARSSNVAIRPKLRNYEITVGTTPSVPLEQVIPLSDLVVGVEGEHFYLWSQQLQKKVSVGQLHKLNLSHAPNVCHFLVEASSDGSPLLSSFDWGSLSTAPFLPRMTVRLDTHATLVLSPASWNLQAASIEIQGEGDIETRWLTGLQHWRREWHVPRFVYLTEVDNRLLLDLDHPVMAAELFNALAKLKEDQQVVLQELIPDFDHLWLTDTQGASYFSEIVVPLLRRDAIEPRSSEKTAFQADTSPSITHVVSRQTRVFFPGDAWQYLKLYASPDQQEEIIAGPMGDLIGQLREQQLIDRWFFLHYADPQPHLRLRIHATTNEQIQPSLHLFLSWSRQLARQGLIQRSVLDTYEREVARYGGPAAIDLLEHIFSLDSDLCQRLIAAQYTHRLTIDPLAVAVVSLDRLFSIWGYDLEHRVQWLQNRSKTNDFRKEFHNKRQRYIELLAPCQKRLSSDLVTQRDLLQELIMPLGNQLPALVEQLHDLARTKQLWEEEEDLLASIAHMHKVRLLDLNVTTEQHLYAFWRYTLESIRLRPRG